MSNTSEQHRREAPDAVRCAVVTVSDSRNLKTDRGGPLVIELLEGQGHQVVAREIVPDEPQTMHALLKRLAEDPSVDAILMTGGTGIGGRDQTYETVVTLLTKTLPGYGELFRQLSFEEIGPAAMLSRATGGLVDETILLTMPGSPAAVRLAMEQVILPELGHLVREARTGRGPQN